MNILKTPIALALCLLAGCSTSQADDAAPTAKEQERIWEQCTLDSECVGLRGMCGRWVAVNRTYLDDAIAHYKRINMLVRCRPIVEPERAVACREGQCIANGPTTDSRGMTGSDPGSMP